MNFNLRLTNTALCQDPAEELDQTCKPRCVSIDRELSTSPVAEEETAELSYDCEIGFYSSIDTQMTPTSGDSYELDIWLEDSSGEARRGSFLFVMPEVTTAMDSLPLLDKTAMEQNGVVVLHTPGESSSHAKERWTNDTYDDHTDGGVKGTVHNFSGRVWVWE